MEKPDKTFMGFAVLTASEITDVGSYIEDSRRYFLGHADIIHTTFLNPDEPLKANENRLLNDILRSISEKARYYEDPFPDIDKWNGANLE